MIFGDLIISVFIIRIIMRDSGYVDNFVKTKFFGYKKILINSSSYVFYSPRIAAIPKNPSWPHPISIQRDLLIYEDLTVKDANGEVIYLWHYIDI